MTIIKEYQITLISGKGFKPVSTIVKNRQTSNEDLTLDKEIKKILVKKGIQNICAKRMWGSAELKKYDYTHSKIREYDKKKIEKESKERYEKIKEEHYKNGTWQRPKNAETK